MQSTKISLNDTNTLLGLVSGLKFAVDKEVNDEVVETNTANLSNLEIQGTDIAYTEVCLGLVYVLCCTAVVQHQAISIITRITPIGGLDLEVLVAISIKR